MAIIIDEDLLNELDKIKNKEDLIQWLAYEYDNFARQYIQEYATSEDIERQWEIEIQIVKQKVNDILNLPKEN